MTLKTPKYYWNYFVAIEKDLEKLSRYIEFTKENLNVYSIELAHILLSASSEVDVVMKQLCELLDHSKTAKNINNYRTIIQNNVPLFINEEIHISRFGLLFKPWSCWAEMQNPDWWGSYNNVKHERNNYFKEANLQNAINAVGALLLANIYYYKYSFSKEENKDIRMKEVTNTLEGGCILLQANADYYYNNLVV